MVYCKLLVHFILTIYIVLRKNNTLQFKKIPLTKQVGNTENEIPLKYLFKEPE